MNLFFKKNKKIPTIVDDFLYEINEAITHNELPLYLSYDKESALTIKRACEKYHIKMEDVAIIGDQIITDVFMGNRLHMTTVLVDPITDNDLKITYFNLNSKKWTKKTNEGVKV